MTQNQYMEEIDWRIWMKSKENKNLTNEILSTKNKSHSLESRKPIGFIASKNKDFSIKKIFPVSTFFH